MVRRMGWVVRHEIDAEVLWCIVAPLRQLIVGHVVCVPVMGLVCYLVIAYLLGCPWQIVPCGCVTLGDWTIVRDPYLVA